MRADVLAIALVFAFAVRVGIAIEVNAATMDEPEYITAGYSYIATHELRLDTWHPPLALLASGLAVRLRGELAFAPDPDAWTRADARRIARTFMYAPAADADAILHAARIPSAVFGVATVLLIGAWARRLWGPRAGLLALALAAFEPTLIAHAAIATPDAMLTFFMLLAMVAAWHYARAPSRRRWFAILGCAALAVATKHVGFLVGPAIAIAFAERALAEGRGWLRHVGRALAETAALAVVAIVGFVAIGGAPGGLVRGFARGLHDQLWHLGHVPPAYLHGHLSKHGFWAYYLVVLVVKVPLGTLALVGASATRRRAGTALERRDLLFVCVPPIVVIAFVTWTRIDIGIRLILPALPFAIVLASRAATFTTVWARRFVVGAVAATLVSSALATTRELAYVNELARATGGAAAWVSDSNLDWGQDLDRLDDYLREIHAPPIYLAYFGGGSPTHLGIHHETLDTAPAYWPNADVGGDASEPGAPCRADRQLIAISVMRMQGMLEARPALYDWLAEMTPIRVVGDSIRVYDITADAESHARLAIIFGATSPAGRCEIARAIALEPNLAKRFTSR